MDMYVTPVNASKTPIIENASRELEKQFSEITELVVALESRLMPVMCEPEPSKPLMDKIEPAQSVLATMLNRRIQEAENLSFRLASILRRLEI